MSMNDQMTRQMSGQQPQPQPKVGKHCVIHPFADSSKWFLATYIILAQKGLGVCDALSKAQLDISQAPALARAPSLVPPNG